MKSVSQLRRLVRVYEEGFAKSPNRGAVFVEKYDYVIEPKDDGYRSVHFVCKYRSAAARQANWNGLRIEIQLRSRLQHAWATAVETVDTFTRQTLKTGGGGGAWKRFFLLMSGAIAMMESSPAPPGCPATKAELRAELRTLATTLRVKTLLGGWATALSVVPDKGAPAGKAGAAVYLLYLEASQERILVTPFASAQHAKASEVYLTTEKAIRDTPDAQAVLVSVSSLQALRSAFPNYFADTRVFIDTVNQALQGRFSFS